jgi:hypothetical protein
VSTIQITDVPTQASSCLRLTKKIYLAVSRHDETKVMKTLISYIYISLVMKSIIFWDITPCSLFISQKLILFIITAVKTSDPTSLEEYHPLGYDDV